MLKKLKELFLRGDRLGPDGLTQPQREAIIDVLLLCMYADHEVALNEDLILHHETESFNWSSKIPIEEYIDKANTKTRKLLQEEEGQESQLLNIANRLETTDARFRALKLCKILFYSDWNLAEEEKEFIRSIRKAFALN